MFSKTRQLLRGMSVPFKLAWLLLLAGMALVYSFVTSIPAHATLPRSRRLPS